MKRNNIYMAAVAIAVALAFVMPGAAAFANVGTIGVTSNSENTDTINIVEDGEGPIDKREVTSDTSDVVEDAVLGSGGNIIYVGGSGPDNSTTIQGGINAASSGDTVYVYNGIYYENLTVDKSINLVGESKEGTIVDGSNGTEKILCVIADNVNVSSFTIRNGRYGPYIRPSSYSSITNCIGNNIKYGIYIREGEYNRVSDCISYGNAENGIYVYGYNTTVTNCTAYNCKNGIKVASSKYSIITNCTSYNNNYGILIFANSGDNEIYHNNFFDNSVEDAKPDEGWVQMWDNGYPSGGNYYSDYTGVDDYHGPNQDISGSDGIGDTAYEIPGDIYHHNWDYYPLMYQWGTPPEITGVTATPESQSIGGNVNITCNVEDVHNGVKPAIVNITDPTGSQQGFEMTGINVDYLGNGEYCYDATYPIIGMYSYFIRAENWRDCGNESDVYQFEITSEIPDTVPPVTNCTLMGTVGENGWYVSDVEVNLTVTDPPPSSGINYTMYKLDGTNWTEYVIPFIVGTNGTHTVEYNSTDNAGNVESTKSVDFKIDKTAPETSCGLDPPEPNGENDWYVSDVEVMLTATDDTSGVNYTMYNLNGTGWIKYTVPFTMTTDGTHTVEYNSTDNASNTESTKSVDFKIDKTDPVTTHSLSGTMGNDGWYTSNVVVTLTASDVTSGIDYTKYNLDGTGWTEYGSIIVTTDGTHTVEYNSTDNASNTESTKSVDFKIDKTNPETTCELDPPEPDGENDWYVSDVEVTLTATDDTSEVNYTMYNLDGTGWTEYTVSFTVTTDGIHTVEYYSVDMTGNIEPTKSVSFKIDKTVETSCELDPPEPDGENDWYVSDVEVTLTATDDNSGMNYTMYNLDGTNWTEYTISIPVTTDGTHTVEYYSVDMAGNIEPTKSVSFKIDQTTAPETSCELDPPEPDGENNWYVSDVEVTLTATDDNSGVNYTMYNLDETGWIGYTVSFMVTTDGPHTVEYYSVDMAGNVESNKSVSFKIDQTAPTINLTVNKTGFNKWLLTANVSDETSGVARVEFYLNGKLLGNVTEAPYEWECSGKGPAQAIVYDNAGNDAESEEVEVVSQSQSQSQSSSNLVPVQRRISFPVTGIQNTQRRV